MRLTRLYSNKPDVFTPIVFNQGFSAVVAEIRVPENQLLDTHNLGKTTVGQLVDYCLLKGKSKSFFLFKHEEFADFTFYLEVELDSGGFVTIARPVTPGPQVDILRSDVSIPDATNLGAEDWDHVALPFTRAKNLLDGILAIRALQPWPFRKVVGYLIRSQRDYNDVFQLHKFSGPHRDWKPFVAHLLGLSAQPVIDLYAKRDEREAAETRLATLASEWGGDQIDVSLIDGLIDVKRRAIADKQNAVTSFQFLDEERRRTSEVVDEVETRIAELNEERYHLARLIQRIETSLAENQIMFRPADAATLFEEAGIVIGEQITHDFEELIAFNHAISNERRTALRGQLDRAQTRSDELLAELGELDVTRAGTLEFLRESDSLVKFKDLSRELAVEQGELRHLEERRAAATRLTDLRREHRMLNDEVNQLITAIEDEISSISLDEGSHFSTLRRHFGDIIREVLNQQAVLTLHMNNSGGVDFNAEFVDDSGLATSGDRGTSYRKVLCIAFDLALLRTYLDVPFPRFVYHDGALEQLEPRKREKLIGVFRDYAALGIQPIISALDTELPAPVGSTHSPTLAQGDIVVALHDEGEEGRLFRMPSW